MRQPKIDTSKIIGHSLSFCMADILEGKIKVKRILKLTSGTMCGNVFNFIKLLRTSYLKNAYSGGMLHRFGHSHFDCSIKIPLWKVYAICIYVYLFKVYECRCDGFTKYLRHTWTDMNGREFNANNH